MAWAGGVGFVLSSKNDGITCRLREASYNYVRVHITCRVQVEHKSAGYLAYFVATRYFHIQYYRILYTTEICCFISID